MKRTIQVTKGDKVLGTIVRKPQQRAGYEVVNFKGCVFQLFGGIRSEERINIERPISCRRKRRR